MKKLNKANKAEFRLLSMFLKGVLAKLLKNRLNTTNMHFNDLNYYTKTMNKIRLFEK